MEAAAALFRAASGAKYRILKNRLDVGGSEWLLGEVGWWGRGGPAGRVTPNLQACGHSEIRPAIGGMPGMVLLWSERPVVHVSSLSLAAKI